MTHTLTDHESIKRWAREHGATPAHVKGTGRGHDTLRFEFEMEATNHDTRLERLDWDDWFQRFDEGGLALIVDDAADAPNANTLVRRAQARPYSQPPRAAEDDDDLFDESDDEIDEFEDEDRDR
jgi:hypothetical protein